MGYYYNYYSTKSKDIQWRIQWGGGLNLAVLAIGNAKLLTCGQRIAPTIIISKLLFTV